MLWFCLNPFLLTLPLFAENCLPRCGSPGGDDAVDIVGTLPVDGKYGEGVGCEPRCSFGGVGGRPTDGTTALLTTSDESSRGLRNIASSGFRGSHRSYAQHLVNRLQPNGFECPGSKISLLVELIATLDEVRDLLVQCVTRVVRVKCPRVLQLLRQGINSSLSSFPINPALFSTTN